MVDGGSGSRGLPERPTLDYPLDYTFKVIGVAADDFPEYARRLVARIVGDAPPERVRVRASAQGKYQSVSVPVRLVSEEQRRAVYELLYADARVVYYL